jgi:diphthine synthase
MSVPSALGQLLSLLDDLEDETELFPDRLLAVSASRIGAPDQTLLSGTIAELAALDEARFGGPLHSFVIVGKRLHPMERDFAGRWAVDGAAWRAVCADAYGCKG